MEKMIPLLSVCIPTWNRAKYLELSLESFMGHMLGINPDEIELFVSDNHSEEETSAVVQKYIEKGLPITYNRNEENVGAARNFLKCMQMSSGKYILLLGDDDILNPGALKYLLNLLRQEEYGVIHIHKFKNIKKGVVEYDDVEKFFRQVSYMFTFVSGTVFRHDIIDKVDADKYISTRLMQVPFFLTSALSKNSNLLINQSILKGGLDSGSNGGYNFYEVFVRNYLNIWQEFVDNGTISKRTFKALKKDIYVHFIKTYNYRLLARHENVKEKDNVNGWCRNGFMVDGAMDILFEYYGRNGYFYWSLIKLYYRKFLAFVFKTKKVDKCLVG